MSIDVDRSVTKSFGDFVALDDVYARRPDGLADRAARARAARGKSTLLRIIAGPRVRRHRHRSRIDGRRRHRRAAAEAQHRLRLPALRRLQAHDGRATTSRFGLEIRKRPKAEIAARVDELLELVSLARLPAPLPSPALRRPAPADGAGPRARRRADGAAARRAVRRARRQGPQGAARLAAPAARRGARDHRLRHPRPGGGAGGRRPDRGDQRGPDRAGRHPADLYDEPGERLRDGLPRRGHHARRAARARRTTSQLALERATTRTRRRWSSGSSTSASRCASSCVLGDGRGAGRSSPAARPSAWSWPSARRSSCGPGCTTSPNRRKRRPLLRPSPRRGTLDARRVVIGPRSLSLTGGRSRAGLAARVRVLRRPPSDA